MAVPWLRRTLVMLELFLSAGAFYGGVSLIMDPTGHLLQMPAERFLVGGPFQNFLVPGFILLAVNGLVPLAVVGATLLGYRWATRGHVAVGVLLIGWMVGQAVLLGFGAPIQVVYLGLGVLILALALWNWSRERHVTGGGPLPA